MEEDVADVEVPLAGGHVGGAVRVGQTVRRPVGPWTPAVHALLDHLAAQGVSRIPQVLGFDGEGRESLAYLPGHVVGVDDDAELTDAQLASLARWARSMHDAVAGWSHAGPWRFFGAEAIATHITHNDLNPSNVCFDGDDLAGVFDWDLAGPSTPMLDLAQLAWRCIPLVQPIPSADAARRLRIITEAYAEAGHPHADQPDQPDRPGRECDPCRHPGSGRDTNRTLDAEGFTAEALLDAVPQRVQIIIDGIPEAVRRGDVAMENLVAAGEPAATQRSLDDLMRRASDIRAHL